MGAGVALPRDADQRSAVPSRRCYPDGPRSRRPPAPCCLTACGKTQAAFDGRCIPPEPPRFAGLCVAFRSKYTRYSSLTRLVSRAPRPSRRSPGFHHRLLTACGKTQAAQFSRWGLERRCIPPEPPPHRENWRFAALCVAFRSKYTRYSSLTRLVSRAPRHSRRSRGFHHTLLNKQRFHAFRHHGVLTGAEHPHRDAQLSISRA